MSQTTRSLEQVPAQRRPALAELAAALRGELALPGTDAYARLTSVDAPVALRPLAAVAAADAYDVVAAVRTAGEHGLRVGVVCTGLGTGTDLSGTLLVRTGALDECVVHRDGWARVGAGLRWGSLQEAAAPSGWAPVTAAPSHAGVVGSTTAGGTGPLARTLGLASDRVRALDVVTGDGRLVRATPSRHGDLFWAVRGGGGALGVVTAVELDLVPRPVLSGATLHVRQQDAPAVLEAWAGWSTTVPEAVSTSLTLGRHTGDRVPVASADPDGLAVHVVTLGAAWQAQSLLAPLRAVARPLREDVGPLADGDHDLRGSLEGPLHERAVLLAELPGEAVEALLVAVAGASASAAPVLEVRRLGGAAARPGPHPSAVRGRDAAFLLRGCWPAASSAGQTAAEQRWQVLTAALAPWTTGPAPGWTAGAGARDRPTRQRLRALVDSHDPAGLVVAADGLLDEPSTPATGGQRA